MADLTWVTFSWAISDPLTGPRPQHGGRGDVLHGQTAAGRDLLPTDEGPRRLHGGVDDVDRVGGAEALGEHVVDAGALEHGTHRTTGDDTGTGAGRLEQHDTGGRLTLDRVRDGAGDPRHAVEVLLGLLDALGDRRGHLLGLAVADAHHAVTVADDHQRGEAEAPTTLDDLGDAVDGDNPLDVLALLLLATATTVAATAAATGALSALLGSAHQITPLNVMSAIRTSGRPRGRPRPGPRRDRDTCCRPGRTRPRRLPQPSLARPPARRRHAPWRSCRRRASAGRPPWWRRTPASCRGGRRRPAR